MLHNIFNNLTRSDVLNGLTGICAVGGIAYLIYDARRKRSVKNVITTNYDIGAIESAVFSDANAINKKNNTDKHENYEEFTDRTKQRLLSTFGAVGTGLLITTGSSIILYNSQAYHNLMIPLIIKHPLLTCGGLIGLSWATLFGTQITNKKNVLQKKAFYVAFCSSIGLILAPLGIFGGPVIVQAIALTGAMTGSLALIAASSPSKYFLSWAGPLATCLGVLVASSFGALLFPVSCGAFTALHSISLYGGLGIYSGLMLSDTQEIIEDAKNKPNNRYDHINSALSIYLNAINLFIRMAEILALSKDSEDDKKK